MHLFHNIILVSVLAAYATYGHPNLLKRCSMDDWVPNVDRWNALGVDNWIQHWWKGGSHQTPSFLDALVSEFMKPDASSFQCSVNHIVHTVGEEGKPAWFSLVAISNLNSWFTTVYNGISTAQLQANSYAAGVVKSFSEAGLPPRSDSLLAELLNLFGTAFSIAATPFLGGLAAPIPAGLASGFIIALESRSADLTLDKLASFGDFVGDAAEQARKVIDSSDIALMQGGTDASNSHIWDYLKGGQFTSPPDPRDAMGINNWLQTILVAGGINTLWKGDRTYIVSADSPDYGSDTRGPSKLRYCANPPDGRVHYAYMMPDFGEPYPQPWEPIGSDDATMGGHNLTLQMAMKSSIDADRAQPGYNYSSSRVDRWAEAINRTDGNTPWVQGGGFEGVFTIPVCYDPSGTSITSVRSNGGRHYPCSCLDGNGGDQTVLFAYATGLFSTESIKFKYCNFCFQNQGTLVDGQFGECWEYVTNFPPAI